MIILLQDRILFKRVEIEQKSKGGIILTATEVGDSKDIAYGEVIDMGEGKYVDGVLRPMKVIPKDIITFNDRMPLKWIYRGDEYYIIRESDVISVLRDEDLAVKAYTDIAHDYKEKARMIG